MRLEKVLETLKKYRLPALVVLAGMVLMLLPTGTKTDKAEDTAEDEGFSLTETEQRMAEVIGAIDGVGRVKVMLTLRSGETLSLAEDSSASQGSGGDVRRESQVLTVNRAGGGGHPADVPCLSGCGGGLPGGRRQPGAADGHRRGVSADWVEQRQNFSGQVEKLDMWEDKTS